MTVDFNQYRRRRTEICLAGIMLGVVLAVVPACGQTAPADVDAVRSSLSEVLLLTTFGAVAAQDQAAEVTRRGANYQVLLPLRGFSAPADAIVRPLGESWDVASLMFPASGTFDTAAPNGGGIQIRFAIGEQSIHAEVDPSLIKASTFSADISAVSTSADQDDRHTRQVLDRYIVDSTVSAEQAGRLSFASRLKATNWHLTTHDGDALTIDSLVRGVFGHVSAEGLDRDQGNRLMQATRALMSGIRPPETGMSGLSSSQRQALRAMADAAPGLLSRFQIEETLDGIHISAGPDNSGRIDRIHFAITGGASDDRLNAQLEIGVDEPVTSALSDETARLLPHHVDLKSALAGVQSAPLLALWRAATEPDADPDALRGQLMALLADPRAHIAIDSVTFDCGPMRVAGSAKIVPLADGQLSAAIHVSATGVDALIAMARRNPAMQQVLPMMAIAKSKGRPDGDHTVWDFTFGL